MASEYQKLQNAERDTYQIWMAWTREIDSARHKAQHAPMSEKRHAEAMMDMAAAASVSAFDHWLAICDAIDTLESQNARDPATKY
jgi:hypothetical protein